MKEPTFYVFVCKCAQTAKKSSQRWSGKKKSQKIIKWKKAKIILKIEQEREEEQKILERFIISDFFGLPFHVFHFASHRWSIEFVGSAKYRMRIKKVKDSRNVFLLQTFYKHTQVHVFFCSFHIEKYRFCL